MPHLLHLQGISSIVIEARSRVYIENRLRAGVLEHATVDLFRKIGLGERMDREGLLHEGVFQHFPDSIHKATILMGVVQDKAEGIDRREHPREFPFSPWERTPQLRDLWPCDQKEYIKKAERELGIRK